MENQKLCLNCKHELSKEDKFCSQCGQSTKVGRLKFKEYVTELLTNVLSYDSRLWNSLKPFFIRPGELPRQYREGRRQSYIMPFRLFMLLSIVFFLFANLGPYADEGVYDINFDLPTEGDTMAINDSMTTWRAAQPKPLDGRVDSLIEAMRSSLSPDEIYRYAKTYPDTPAINALSNLNVEVNSSNIRKYDFWAKFARTSFPDLAAFILDKLPMLIILFMPFWAMLMKLLYIRRDFYYTEHLTFLLYTNSMFFLLAILSLFINKVCNYQEGGWGPFLFVLYFFLSMKRFYAQSIFKTLLKFFLILFCCSIMLPIFAILSIGVLFYIY